MKEGKILDRVLKEKHTRKLQEIVQVALNQENLVAIEKDNNLGIEKLPAECLISIFNHLPVVDRARVERVSKKWQILAKQSWNGLDFLTLNPVDLGLKPFGIRHQYIEIFDFRLREILKRCGNYLTEINLFDSSNCMLYEVAEYCPDIEFINCNNPSLKGLKKLAEKCKKMVGIFIKNLKIEHENALGDLFYNNKEFDQLHVETNGTEDGYLNGDCLSKLPLDKMVSIKADTFNLLNLSCI